VMRTKPSIPIDNYRSGLYSNNWVSLRVSHDRRWLRMAFKSNDQSDQTATGGVQTIEVQFFQRQSLMDSIQAQTIKIAETFKPFDGFEPTSLIH
jgi:hypothetical protein